MADGLMAGKRGLIMGVANNRSIAWGIAKALAGQGAEIAFSYQGEALKKRVEPLAAEAGSSFVVECDVSNDAAIDETFGQIRDKWGHLDFLVHAIGFSDKNELDGRYIDTSAANFQLTMNISVYSFTAVAKRAEPLMSPGSSLLTLTYYGAQSYIPNYNVMGVAKAALETSVRYLAVDIGARAIRVNAISAGAIKTLAASGISGSARHAALPGSQCCAPPQCQHRRCRQSRALSPLRPAQLRRHRRDPLRRCGLQRCRHGPA